MCRWLVHVTGCADPGVYAWVTALTQHCYLVAHVLSGVMGDCWLHLFHGTVTHLMFASAASVAVAVAIAVFLFPCVLPLSKTNVPHSTSADTVDCDWVDGVSSDSSSAITTLRTIASLMHRQRHFAWLTVWWVWQSWYAVEPSAGSLHSHR
jgi:hypothetical protein